MHKFLEKPDGRTEEILELNEYYMLKKLVIPRGVQTSMHYHVHKIETLYGLFGVVGVRFADGRESVELRAGQTLAIGNGRENAHQMWNVTGNSMGSCIYLEASTPHPEDSCRVLT